VKSTSAARVLPLQQIAEPIFTFRGLPRMRALRVLLVIVNRAPTR
jgi:hypothetical protein